MSTVCLSMIVKNETHIIHECLDSIYKHIDYWVIVDTGSTDGTQELIKSFLKKKVFQVNCTSVRGWVSVTTEPRHLGCVMERLTTLG